VNPQDDPYQEGLFKICSLYRHNKEVVRSMIGECKVVTDVLSTMYLYLVARGEIDPCLDEDRVGRAKYLLEVL
jgi:hypothetical protein